MMFGKNQNNIAPVNNRKNINIQLARAFAITMVVMQHYKIRMPTSDWYLDIFRYVQLWPGVDLFLAISGFLMCQSLFREIEKGDNWFNTFKNFLTKRVLRLYPVLIVWGGLTVLVCFISGERFYTNALSELKTFVFSLIALSNVYLHHCVVNGYLCSNASGGVTWSLSLEWQLYLALAFLVISFYSYKLFLISSFVLICILSIFIPAADPQNMALAWWIRPIPFFIGAIIFFANNTKIQPNPIMSYIIAMAAFIVLISAPIRVSTQYVSLAIGIAGGTLFYVFLYGLKFKNNIITQCLNWIGDRSYSIYLCHIPIMLIVSTFLEFLEIKFHIKIKYFVFFTVYVFTMLGISHITYIYVELKGIDLARKILNKNRP
ncbi:acyltransferase family protein [Candidatus Pantoea formicae]|uniref:acyltransferase family protein n=1 Tax=Candidatus Pantoea formicae TaxID=2608355 RepID=UPI003EDB2E86